MVRIFIFCNINFTDKSSSDYKNAGEMWRAKYEDKELISKVDKLWEEVQPLYNELHRYMKNQLEGLYGDKMKKGSEFIPAHLLGNMWVSKLKSNQTLDLKRFLTGSDLGSSLRPNEAFQKRITHRCHPQNGARKVHSQENVRNV
jgi:Angiotensin-converting enzyme